MELNRDKIIKGLECCHDLSCNKCPYTSVQWCAKQRITDTLALIKELTEKNERLRENNLVFTVSPGDIIHTTKNVSLKIPEHSDPIGERGVCGLYKQCQVDTVRKMQERLKKKGFPNDDGEGCVYVADIDQVAKEILEKE